MNQLTKAAKAVATRYNQTSLILRITVGLVVGAALALICPGAAWIEELGNLFVGALKGIAPVLVFVIVASALAQGSSAGPPLRHGRLAVYAHHLCGGGAQRRDQQAVPQTLVLAEAATADVIPRAWVTSCTRCWRTSSPTRWRPS